MFQRWLGASVLLLAAIAVAAGYLPARRAYDQDYGRVAWI